MKLILIVSAVAALTAANGASHANAVTDGARRTVPAPRAAADSADSLWRLGRRAIADESWERAATIFERLRDRYPRSTYVPDSYYWQAWALYQRGGSSALKQAIALLDTQRERFASASTVKSGDARSLATRIRGVLAQGGDAASAADIAKSAAGASASTGSSVAPGGRRGTSRSSANCPKEEDDDRVEALNALLQMRSDDALPMLRRVMAKREACSEVLRRKAVFLVSQKRGDEAADILIDAAKNDPDSEVREQAVFWLGSVRSEKAFGLLEQILRTSNDEDLQDKALFALTQSRDPRGYQVLRDYASREGASAHLREQAIFWLGQERSDENSLFLKQLFGKTRDEDVQQKILFSVSQSHKPADSDWLMEQAVNARNPIEVRKQAVFWAGQSPRVDVAKLVSLYDKATDHDFREHLIFVLSQRSRAAEAIDKLIQIAKTEKDKELRTKAIFWLGQSNDPRAIKALREIIEK